MLPVLETILSEFGTRSAKQNVAQDFSPAIHDLAGGRL
jgi:hypothetical protein